MPNTSIVVTAKDNYSSVVEKMTSVTESFDKDLKKVEKQMINLSRNKAQLKVDVKAAKQNLKDATENYEKLSNAANRFAMEMAQANYDKAVRNLNAVSKAAKDAEKHISKAENKAASGRASGSAVVSALAASALGDAGKSLAMDIGASFATSFGGSNTGTMVSSVLSYMATGAAVGSVIPVIGTALGTAIGAGVGLAAGGLQIFENKDDFFKDYYNTLYEERISAGETALTAGSTTAGSREQSYKAFEKRLGKAGADAYLSQVKSMAARTNYGYDEILGYSKLLLNSYAPEETFGLLTTLSDASAGLNLSSSDVEMFIKGFSRMRTTGKVTQEYLNYFSERGVDVYEALARGTGADKSKIADMVTRGKIKGADAAEYIVEFLNENYGGLSKELMDTYDAKVANLQDVETNVQEGYGTGYNEERKDTIDDKTKTLDGELGEKLTWVNELSGFAQGYADNVKDNTWMDVMEAVFTGDTELREGVTFDPETQALIDQYRSDYVMAKFDYDNAETDQERYEAALKMDEVKKASEILATEMFNGSETNLLLIDSQTNLTEKTRILAETIGSWQPEYKLVQVGTVGLAGSNPRYGTTEDGKEYYWNDNWGPNPYKSAWGLDRVPYDNYPALLHQGERVLTAQQAREADRVSGVSVVISGNEFHIREDADVDRVAEALLQKLELAAVRG